METSLITNPVFTGLMVFLIIHAAKSFGWAENSKEVLWLTMLVAVGVAAVEALFGAALFPIPSLPSTSDPLLFFGGILQVLEAVAANGGIVLAASQVVYKTLHAQVLLGDKV